MGVSKNNGTPKSSHSKIGFKPLFSPSILGVLFPLFLDFHPHTFCLIFQHFQYVNVTQLPLGDLAVWPPEASACEKASAWRKILQVFEVGQLKPRGFFGGRCKMGKSHGNLHSLKLGVEDDFPFKMVFFQVLYWF